MSHKITRVLLKNSFIAIFLSVIMISCDESPTTGIDDTDYTEQDHYQNPGIWADKFLGDEEFDRLVVQIQYMEGFAPTENSVNRLEAFLEERLNKPSGIVINTEEIPAAGQETYTANEIRDLEKEHRTEYSSGNTLAAYYIFVDGEFSDANVLGIAYYNTSMAIFQKRVQDVSGSGPTRPSREVVETVVLKHEMGHIIGLVDNGSPMQEDHKDEGRGAHCDNDSCLMYFAVNTADFINNLIGNNVPELDENCIADLQANGGK